MQDPSSGSGGGGARQTVAEGGGQEACGDGAGEAARRPAVPDANTATAATALRAGTAGGAAVGAGHSLQSHGGVAAQGRGAHGGGRLRVGRVVPRGTLLLPLSLLLGRLVLVTLGRGGATRLHVAHVLAQQRQQGLLGLLELVLEGEGLDGERGGPLVLAVAHHNRGAVCGR